MEILNKKLKRRTGKIGAFPSENPLMRLVTQIIMDIKEEHVTERKYINMDVDLRLYMALVKLQQYCYTIKMRLNARIRAMKFAKFESTSCQFIGLVEELVGGYN